MRHRDFEVLVTCEGEPLHEYAVTIDGNAIECYVVSEPGKVFEIVCNNFTPKCRSVQSTVDGRCFPRRSVVKGNQLDRRLSVEDGIDGAKPLLFSTIAVTDDEEAATGPACEGELGEIQLRVVRSELKEAVQWIPSPLQEPRNFGTVHETVKKAGLHCVSFGATVPVERRRYRLMEYLDTFELPYITFKFRYRPRAILQAQGVIDPDPRPNPSPVGSPGAPSEPTHTRETRSPSVSRESVATDHRRRGSHEPSPSPRPRKRPRQESEDDEKPAVKGEDGILEDVDELEAQLLAIRQRIDRAKALQTGESASRVIKREVSPIRVGRFHGGIIDLTDD